MPAPTRSPRAKENPRHKAARAREESRNKTGGIGGTIRDLGKSFREGLRNAATKENGTGGNFGGKTEEERRPNATAGNRNEPVNTAPKAQPAPKPAPAPQPSFSQAERAKSEAPADNAPKSTADPGPKHRPATPADSTLLAKALRDKATGGGGSYRGSVLSTLYGLPSNRPRAVRTLQSFNGKQGSKLVLGQ